MAKFDLIVRGGRVIDPASGLDGVHDVAVKDGTIRAGGAADRGHGRSHGRRAEPARDPRHDRHAQPHLPARHRRLRDEPGRGWRSLGRDRRRRPGRRRPAHHPGLPEIHQGPGRHARLCLRLELPRGRSPRTSPCRPLWPARDQRQGNDQRHREEPRHRQGHQVSRGGRRLLALGHRDVASGQGSIARDPGAGLRAPRPPLGGRERDGDRSRQRHRRRVTAPRTR